MGHGVGARVFVPSLCVYLLANKARAAAKRSVQGRTTIS